MFDYVFFNSRSRDRFVIELERLNVPCQTRTDEAELVVSIDEEVDDARLDAIDETYDRLLSEEQALFEAEEAPEMHAAGITIQLRDGRTVQAAVEPALLNRLLEAVSIEELGRFVQIIASAVENPDERPFCQQARDR